MSRLDLTKFNTKIQIRPSGVGSFFDCSHRWYRDTIYKPIRSVGYQAHFGSAVHKGAECYYEECMKADKWLPFNSSYEDAGIETWTAKCKDEEPDNKSEVPSKIEFTLRDSMKAYIANARLLNKGKIPIAVEKTYTKSLIAPHFSDVSGTLDIVGDDYVGDIKTMSRQKAPTSYTIQQSIYALLRELNGEKVEDLHIHRVIVNHTKHSILVDSVSILDTIRENSPYITIENLLTQASTMLETIVSTCENFFKTGDESLFRGNPSSTLCSRKYCAYYDECKFKKF